LSILQLWHDVHDQAVLDGMDRDDAVKLADDSNPYEQAKRAVLFGAQMRFMEPGAVYEYTPIKGVPTVSTLSNILREGYLPSNGRYLDAFGTSAVPSTVVPEEEWDSNPLHH
jgi:hypothetical protein